MTDAKNDQLISPMEACYIVLGNGKAILYELDGLLRPWVNHLYVTISNMFSASVSVCNSWLASMM